MTAVGDPRPDPGYIGLRLYQSRAISSEEMSLRGILGRCNSGLRARTALAALVLLGTAGLAGCRPLPPSKPEAQLTTEERAGEQVFQSYCARCHYPTTTHGKKGPGLQALTKVKAMPSGAPPTDERILATITHGRGMMQPVPVPDDELGPLLDYLHTL
jgi:mono/diheme cytochrome c family protein